MSDKYGFYKDCEGKGYSSLPALCRENNIPYAKCYRLYKKGIDLQTAIKMCKDPENEEKIKEDAENFKPETVFPSVEYIRYLKHYITLNERILPTKKGMEAHECGKLIDGYRKAVKDSESFGLNWLQVMDYLECGKEPLSTSAETINEAKILLSLVDKNPLLHDIYISFAKNFHLGRYCPS